MKRRNLCVICLVLYILISCTILSLKIEKEMLTQVEVLNVKGIDMLGQSVSLPQTVLFKDAQGIHLYEVIEDSGWESGLRIREIAPVNYELDNEKGTICLPGGSDYCFITTASRQPVVGELVEIIESKDAGLISDAFLFVYPQGVPEDLLVTDGLSVKGQSDEAVLVSIERTTTYFFEHKQMGEHQAMNGPDWRIFSQETVRDFWEQIPFVAVIAGILLCVILLWFYFYFMCSRAKRFGRIFLSAVVASLISLVLVYTILSFINLPAAMLPDTHILKLSHYSDELRTVCRGLASLCHYENSFHEFYNKKITECLIILGSTLTLTILLIVGNEVLYRKRSKPQQD